MRYAADLHLHSHYSRATSKNLNPEMLDLWGRLKGLAVIGTGDFTHPGWLAEIEEKLAPAEEGLFLLKVEHRLSTEASGLGELPAVEEATGRRDARSGGTRFLLTAEISSIYKQGGRVRKVHNVVLAPSFATARGIQKRIERLGGNIRSDGRPILGIDSRDLLELCLDVDPAIFFLPAHIWTPWFSALGSKSGFDSIEECFRDLAGHISAVETGLSSDPPMNWMCSFLDRYTLVSNSDAHSPERLAREACLFDADLSYPAIVAAMGQGASGGFRGTIEFFPQEGKYHFDGHRKCAVSWDPLETLRHGGVCPECGRPVTVGVLSRVAELADRTEVEACPRRDPFHSLIPLTELLAEIEGTGPGSKKVQAQYARALSRLGPELEILAECDPAEIAREAGETLALSIGRMRDRRVRVEAGYDGEYGRITVWGGLPAEGETHPALFAAEAEAEVAGAPAPLVEFDLASYQELRAQEGLGGQHGAAAADAAAAGQAALAAEREERLSVDRGLNPEQEEAASYSGGHCLVIAGPGSGKTFTIVERIRRLVAGGAEPGSIVAVTFANRAARELLARLRAAGIAASADTFWNETGAVRVATFHALGLSIIKPHLELLGRSEAFLILDDEEKDALLASAGMLGEERRALIDRASRIKSGRDSMPGEGEPELARFKEYQAILKRADCFDFDDLVYLPLRLFRSRPDILGQVQARLAHLIIDEYQDINGAQFEFARALAERACLCAVGDPNQAIYGFRGASPRFIEGFSEDFPGARIISLRESYRCPDPVLRASAGVIGRASSSLAGRGSSVKIALLRAPSAAFEAEQIARDIEARTGGTGFFSFDSSVVESSGAPQAAPSEIAVLCRTHLQMAPIEQALRDHRIPYRTIRVDTPFAREPYRSFLNLMRLLSVRGSGARAYIGPVGNADERRIEALALPSSLSEAIRAFAQIQITPPADSLLEEMEEDLGRFWGAGDSVASFIEHARLGSGLDRYDSRIQAVSLMTIHASKGLEFDVVYVPGCEDSLFPCTIAGEASTDEEEERRLLYVAMTRARTSLILSSAGRRVIFGKTREQAESPFLRAIEQTLIERREPEVKRGKRDGQLSLLD